jgi:predicted O-methyltransferase YrrM
MIIVDNTVRRGAVIEPNHPDDRVHGIRSMNDRIKELEEKGLISAAPVQIVG